MKRSFLSEFIVIFLMLITITTVRGQENRYWQFGVFGGVSSPIGDYDGKVGHANKGVIAGTTLNYYFTNVGFGIGLDARFINHPLDKKDTIHVENGIVSNLYDTEPRFRHISLAIGPTYQFRKGKFGAELYSKGGVMLQQFPKYVRMLVVSNYTNPEEPTANRYDVLKTTGPTKANAWNLIAGLNLNYQIKNSWGIFLNADYQTSVGTKFFDKESQFKIGNLPVSTRYTHEDIGTGTTKIQMFNFGIGVKYLFGKFRNFDELNADL